MPYVTTTALGAAIQRLHGTADHMLKIWWALKQMGMTPGHPVEVDTGSPTSSLKRLFSYGDPDGKLFVPFAHTQRFKTMEGDAARSIVQTSIRRWLTSGSVVQVDPTGYLDITEAEGQRQLFVSPGRNYPQGLGFGTNGFARSDNTQVSIPDCAFAIWYFRQSVLPDGADRTLLRKLLGDALHLSPLELDLILVPDTDCTLTWQDHPLSDAEVYRVVLASLNTVPPQPHIVHTTFTEHILRVRSMTTTAPGPKWLTADPSKQLFSLIDGGAKAIILYGPPRTGKTRAVDLLFPRTTPTRETIQIHDGWGYDELILALRPNDTTWDYTPGALLEAIRGGKKQIVLEEINRTDFGTAIGEVFSLLEAQYRGPSNAIRLRNGETFFIPADALMICTMNTLDRSTEEIDDALFGRMAAVSFPPRVEDLQSLLDQNGLSAEFAAKYRELFATVLRVYPLGHGYFSGVTSSVSPVDYYLARVRPVLQKHLQNFRDDDLRSIDEKVDQLFG